MIVGEHWLGEDDAGRSRYGCENIPIRAIEEIDSILGDIRDVVGSGGKHT